MSIYEYDEERERKLMLADERELGIQQGIIIMSREMRNTKEKTIELLMEKCNLNKKDAEIAVNRWWN